MSSETVACDRTPATCVDADADRPSYLDKPRLHFAGRFRSDVSTINNQYINFDSGTFAAVNEVVTDGDHAGFNPWGTGVFDFYDAHVTSVCSATAADCTTTDLLVGTSVDTAMSTVSAKIVDVDVEDQIASKLFGLRIGLGAYSNYPPVFNSTFRPAAFTNLWPLVVNRPGGFLAMSARYQSFLENFEWNEDLLAAPTDPQAEDTYEFLRELKQASPNAFSISFNTYIYNTNSSDKDWTYGYVVGTIGPGRRTEPENYIRERFLRYAVHDDGSTTESIVYGAQFKVRDNGPLTVDLGNALSRRLVDGNFIFNTQDMGSSLCIYTKQSNTKIGEIDLSEEWYLRTSGVEDIPIPQPKAQSVSEEYLKVVKCDDQSLLMVESLFVVRPTTTFVTWMNPGYSLDKTFAVTRKGVPQCNYPVTFQVHLVEENIPEDKRDQALASLTVNGQNSVTVMTDCNGMVTVSLEAGDPGTPRGVVDGCMLHVTFTSDEENLFTDSKLIIRVFDDFPYDQSEGGKPTWYGENGVYDILRQYDNLYPVMRHIVRLGDYNSVTDPRNIQYIKMAMELPFDHPSFMPVTRDLSTKKTNMVLDWLKQKYPPKKGKRGSMTLEQVQASLQLAIQVEHATIPVYMYAFYSIKEGYNNEIADVIRSVAIDEMLHMGLVANILISVGGSPNFVRADFIPVYPSRLPGGLHPELTLRLAPLSIGLVQDVFMHIETPMYLTDENEDQYNDTIGGFYKRLRKNLKKLEQEANEDSTTIFGNVDRQAEYDLPGHLKIFKIANLDDALAAIDLITEQGEGSSQIDPLDDYEQLAHYYKFQEIVEGRRLYKKPNGKLEFIGKLL